MVKKIALFSVLIALMPLFMVAQSAVDGTVLNGKTGQPLSGATVKLDGYSTASGSNGGFKFNSIKAGRHHLAVSYVGFAAFDTAFTTSAGINITVKLKPVSYFSEEVIVSAYRAGAETPSSHTNLSQKQIAKQNLAQDLPYLLAQTPSVVVSSDAGTGVGYTGIRIRGTDLTGINVTLNGVPVNDPESGTVYFVDLPDLASSTESMQIQRGVGTSTNGAAAFGASINIKTDGFADNPYAEYAFSGGSFNTFKNTVKFGTGIMDGKWNFTGRASVISSDGYIDRATSNLKSAYFAGGYYGKKDIVKAIVMLGKEKTYQAWYGVPKDSLETNPTYNPAGEMYDNNGNFLGYYNNQTDNYIQNYYQLHYAHRFSSWLNLTSALFYTKGKGYYESYKNNQKFSKYGMADTIIGNDTINRTNLIRQKWLDNDYYGIIMTLNYQKNNFKMNIGGSWNQYNGDHYGKVVWAQVARLGDHDRNWYFNNGIKTYYNLFAKGQYSFTKTLSLYLDLQYRHINYAIDGTHDDLTDFIQNHQYNFFNPKAGVVYKLTDANVLFASVAVANREPSRSDFRDADEGATVLPERLIDYELGYNFNGKRVVFNANAFYMDYKNQLVLTGKINNVGSAIRTNVAKSFRAGIELSAALQVTDWFNWNLNFTYSQNKIKDFTEYVDNWNYWDDPDNQPLQYEKKLGTTDISFSPDIVGSSNLAFTFAKHLKANLVSNYVGRQYIDNTSSSQRSLDPYFINNVKLNYTWYPGFVKSIDFLLSLNNIFNNRYETNAWVYRYVYGEEEYEMNGYFPQAGFNVLGGVVVKF